MVTDIDLDILAAPKAYAQTRQPDRTVWPMLLPSSTKSVTSSPWIWFITVFSIFTILPIALVFVIFSGTFLNQILSEECFVLLRISPLGATAILSYFMVLLLTWGMYKDYLTVINIHITDMKNISCFLVSHCPTLSLCHWTIFLSILIPPKPYISHAS